MKNSLLIIAFLFVFIGFTQAQIEIINEGSTEIVTDPEFENIIWDPEFYYSYRKEIAMDFTPLISKLAPFNLGQTDFGLVGLKFKRYGRKIAFRMNFGANLDVNSNGDNFAYLSIGYEKRKMLTPKFSFVRGWDLFASFEENNNVFFDDDGGIGVANFYGFEYNFNEVFYMATEGQIQVASIDGDLNIKMIIPEAIFIGARF